MKLIICKNVTVKILNSLNPGDVLQIKKNTTLFKLQDEPVIKAWLEKTGNRGRIAYIPKSRIYAFRLVAVVTP